MKIFFQLVCGDTCAVKPLTTIEWYLVFTCSAILLAQLPNLNSIAGVSLIGAVTAVGYCTLIWVLSISKGRLMEMSYEPQPASSDVDRVFGILNALGIIAFAFRGHNLVLEIQVCNSMTERIPLSNSRPLERYVHIYPPIPRLILYEVIKVLVTSLKSRWHTN